MAFVCHPPASSNLLHIQPMRNALSYEPGMLHLSATVTDGSSSGKTYTDADKEKKYINYGGWMQNCSKESLVDAVSPDALDRYSFQHSAD